MYIRIPALAAAVAAGLLVAGCSSSKRRAPAATAAGATTRSTAGPTASSAPTGPLTPQFSFQNLAPASAARQQQARDLFNDELRELWNRLRPGVARRIDNEIRGLAQAGTLAYTTGAFTLGVVGVGAVTFDAQEPPQVTELRYDKLVVDLPRQGDWVLRVDAQVGVSVAIGGFNPTLAFPVTIEVRLAAHLDVDLDTSDPTRPQIARSNNPRANLAISITSSDPTAQRYLQYLNQVARLLVPPALTAALNAFLSPALTTFPGAVWADGAAPLADTGTPVPWEEIAVNVDRKLRRDHMPHGCLHRAVMDTPVDDESWRVAYVNGGPGNVGNVVRWFGESDSAMNTAYFLAAQAWRHRVTRSSEALDNFAWVLRGIGTLLDVNNGSGLLARSAAPKASVLGRHIDGRGAFTQTQLFGDTWVGWQSGGVSRDQYTAVFFGLAIAHEILRDPGIKADCARRVKQMVDYLVAKDWITEDDRPNWTRAGGDKTPLIFKAQAVYQQLTFLTIGRRMHPGAWDAEHARIGRLAPMTWFGAWSSVNTVDGYYRFNLQLLNAYNYYRLETDQQRWMEMARSYRITQRWIGHHRNPHFDLIQSALEPALAARLHPGVRESLRGFLTRNHRNVAPPGLDFSAVRWAPFTLTSLFNANGNTVNMPTEPLPVPLRQYTGYFQWQKQPTRPASRPTDPARIRAGASEEKPGLDYILPYWMGRWHGAF